jgi:hypothetical protein
MASSNGVDSVMGATFARLSAFDTYSSNMVKLFGVGP